MEQDNVSKEFAGLVGDVWHEIIGGQHIVTLNPVELYELYCSCGAVIYYYHEKRNLVTCKQPTYTIELIKARIQARGDWDNFPCNLYNNIFDALTECCDVSDGAIDLPWVMVCAVEIFARVLTTPALLMQAYIAYRRQADRCDGWCRTSKGPIEDMRSLHGAEMGLNVIDKTCREATK